MTTERTTDEHSSRSKGYRIHEFDPISYDWDDWKILLDTYIDVEGISDDIKKRNLLITSLGVQPFKTLISVCKPKRPNEYSYQELVKKLQGNYARVTFASTERVKFFASKQQPSESLTEFANGLRTRTVTCEFPSDFYEQALITAFVGGLRNEHVRKHLMQQELKLFAETLNMARTFESVLIQGANAISSTSFDDAVLKIEHRPKSQRAQTPHICASCGSTTHSRDTCRFRNAECRKCKKQGHIAKVCRSKPSVNTIHPVSMVNQALPIRVLVDVGDHPVQFDLDTGSPITIINERTWCQLGRPTLRSNVSRYNSFSGHPIQLLGQRLFDVVFKGESHRLRLVVCQGHGNNILGRNGIKELRLDTLSLNDIDCLSSVNSINTGNQKITDLLTRYNDIFQDNLGRCTVKVSLQLKEGAKPKFFKPRSLPFAYREAVEADLQRLVSEGVLESISTTEWAAPIVVVPKASGKVRICADFSTGVNQALDIEKYPLPKPNDLFVALNGGTLFSKIDLSEAYLQVEVDDESKKVLVINTHKGLFKFNRLPFGIASAPSLFQKIMDEMLSGLEHTVCYLDDIIVTGTTPENHLRNLAAVLDRIAAYGFRVNRKKCAFLQPSVEYLGFIVDRRGVHSSPSKTKAINDMPQPVNVSQLRSFLGMVNHYAKFVPNLAHRLSPLYSLLKAGTKWYWSSKCDESFKEIKKILVSPLALTHYDPALPIVLAADASNAGVGAVISHRFPDGTEKAIAHASKTLTPAETRYAQIEKEALAIGLRSAEI